MSNNKQKPIFYDEKKIRWKIFLVLFTSSFVITFSLIFYTLYSIVEYTNQWSQNTVETISNYSSNEKILDKDLPNLSLNQDFIKT